MQGDSLQRMARDPMGIKIIARVGHLAIGGQEGIG